MFFSPKKQNPKTFRLFLGFASGVMISASIWSLIIPSIELANKLNIPSLLPSIVGMIFGALFLFVLDILIEKEKIKGTVFKSSNNKLKQNNMMLIAVTLHNIPEGIAVAVTFAVGAMSNNITTIASAFALGIGMLIQNIPEGSAISLPYKNAGVSKTKSFLLGTLSGIVEPIFGVIGVLLISTTEILMPWLLAFAGGAMYYVVCDELIPESKTENSHEGVLGAVVGFVLMMALEILLG